MDSKSQFRQTVSGFEASVGLGPIDRRRGGIVRAVVGLGKPIGLFRRLKEPPLTAEIKAPTLFGGWRGIAELNFRIHSPPAESRANFIWTTSSAA